MKYFGTDAETSGKVIAVEGLDGSGKSTQVYLLKRWLELSGHRVSLTEWNSSVLVKSATKKGKKAQTLTPSTFSLIHCTDFSDRFERQMLPLLRAGYLVLCDRYVYTAYARDGVRGVDAEWLRNLYSFAPKPAITIYFKTPLQVALHRILGGRPSLKYHEAGMDLNLADSRERSFELFQASIMQYYDGMTSEFGFDTIDGALPVEEQQHLVRELVSSRIDLSQFKIDSSQIDLSHNQIGS